MLLKKFKIITKMAANCCIAAKVISWVSKTIFFLELRSNAEVRVFHWRLDLPSECKKRGPEL